jgi:hypothetical protein
MMDRPQLTSPERERGDRWATGSSIIFAGGRVSITGRDIEGMLVVSGGDVEIDCELYNSIIIARGKVHFTNTGCATGSRIVSGKAVSILSENKSAVNLITENEPNPLGYIRWTDEAKDKKTPKAK